MSNSKDRIVKCHLCFPYRTQYSGLHELVSQRSFECMYAWTLPKIIEEPQMSFLSATLCFLLYPLWTTSPSFSEPTATSVFSLHTLVSSLPWALLTAMQSKLGDPFLKVTPADPGLQHSSLAFCTASPDSLMIVTTETRFVLVNLHLPQSLEWEIPFALDEKVEKKKRF